ncbi:hypothetical protein [Legionella cherrii]|uniref:Uncharacterized protein n=1 Tax=Legionella cherrii TaxID=28084 RepID=A0ABY6T4F2_9GAMM|nr:hypothetical protein [Legionella cherrii]VEB35149.1 Uncharacterised protein [Legionella cherrii]
MDDIDLIKKYIGYEYLRDDIQNNIEMDKLDKKQYPHTNSIFVISGKTDCSLWVD